MSSKEHLIVYHAGCADGFCAAWVAATALGRDKCELFPASYGRACPPVDLCRGRHVHVLDFSYSVDETELMVSVAESFTMLDHHDTALVRDYSAVSCPRGETKIVVDGSRSGAKLAWDHYRPDRGGVIVKYVQDRDLWKFELPHSREVSASIASYEQTLEAWDSIVRVSLDYHVSCGQAILRGVERFLKGRERAMRRAKIGSPPVTVRHVDGSEESFDGLATREMAVVHAAQHQSETCDRIMQSSGLPTAACFWASDDAKQWRVSVRGQEARVIAEAFGGGGHDRAAGFSVPIDSTEDSGGLPWRIIDDERAGAGTSQADDRESVGS